MMAPVPGRRTEDGCIYISSELLKMRRGGSSVHIRICMFLPCNQSAWDSVEEKASKRSRDAFLVNWPQKVSKTLVRNLVGMKNLLDEESIGVFVSVFVPDDTR